LGGLVGAFKTVFSKKINQVRATLGEIVWQRNFYEHVIRGENELEHIRNYIYFNPQAWPSDPENPRGPGGTTPRGPGGPRPAPT
jgi:putative transposase